MDRLPRYATPVFVRLPQTADMTGNYKLRKVDLQREGFDPQVVKDPLFVRDDAARSYVPLTTEAVAKVCVVVEMQPATLLLLQVRRTLTAAHRACACQRSAVLLPSPPHARHGCGGGGTRRFMGTHPHAHGLGPHQRLSMTAQAGR